MVDIVETVKPRSVAESMERYLVPRFMQTLLGHNDKEDHAVPREGSGIRAAEGDGDPGMSRV